MKRKILFILYFFTSVLCFIYSVKDYCSKKNWISSTATITFIGLPQGTVFGTYTDINGLEHTDVALYVDYIYQGSHIVSEKYPLINKNVNIVYNLTTNDVDLDYTFFYLFSLLSLLISITLLLISNLNSKFLFIN